MVIPQLAYATQKAGAHRSFVNLAKTTIVWMVAGTVLILIGLGLFKFTVWCVKKWKARRHHGGGHTAHAHGHHKRSLVATILLCTVALVLLSISLAGFRYASNSYKETHRPPPVMIATAKPVKKMPPPNLAKDPEIRDRTILLDSGAEFSQYKRADQHFVFETKAQKFKFYVDEELYEDGDVTINNAGEHYYRFIAKEKTQLTYSLTNNY